MISDSNKNNKKNLPIEELLTLESYIKDFWQFLPLPVCYVNPLHIVLDVDESFIKFSKYASTEIIGEDLGKLFADPPEKIEDLKKDILAKEIISNREMIFLTKDKESIPVDISIIPRKDEKGVIIGYFLSITDISESKKFQQELEEKVKKRTKELETTRMALTNMLEDVEETKERAEEERSKTLAIINNLADGLLIFNQKNKLSLINPRAEEFFDLKSRDIVDRPISELITFPTLKSTIEIFEERTKEIFRKELSLQKPKEITLEITTIPIVMGNERLGTLIILHDITREKMVERLKTEFVSLSAHQLRTPLSAIKWTLRMLLDGDLGKITGEQREFVEKTYQSNERMITLINDLLDVTRIEEGRYVYKPVFSQLEDMVQSVVDVLEEEIKRKEIKFEFKKPETKLPKVKVDKEKIGLVINNLINNAIRYTPSGGEITVSLSYNGKEIEFSVTDTGIGIPKDQQERIFTKFFRAANAMRKGTEGTGLGLFIAKNIVEAHGGKIWFKSKEGEGTTFYFTIPIKKEFEEFLEKF